VRLRETGRGPWPAPHPDGIIAAHEFHYSSLENVPPGLNYAYEVIRGTGIDGRHDGLLINNLVACYSHMRDTAQHHWAGRFIDFVQAVRRDGKIMPHTV
jgi:cobyrinic acid a,c-diamide synthase